MGTRVDADDDDFMAGAAPNDENKERPLKRLRKAGEAAEKPAAGGREAGDVEAAPSPAPPTATPKPINAFAAMAAGSRASKGGLESVSKGKPKPKPKADKPKAGAAKAGTGATDDGHPVAAMSPPQAKAPPPPKPAAAPTTQSPAPAPAAAPAAAAAPMTARVAAAAADDDDSNGGSGGSDDEDDEDDDVGGTGGGDAFAALKAGAAAAKNGGKTAVKPKKAGKKSAAVGVGAGLETAAAEIARFDPGAAATWQSGQPVPYAFVADVMDAASAESGRLRIQRLLAQCYWAVMATTPADLATALYLTNGTLAPAHESLELGLGEATIAKILGEALGKSEASVKALAAEMGGDLGAVARTCRGSQGLIAPPKPLTCQKVLSEFRAVARVTGSKAMDQKKAKVKGLLAAAKGAEATYVVRALEKGRLRIGISEATVLAALGYAASLKWDGVTGPGLPERLKRSAEAVAEAFSVCPSFDHLATALLVAPPSELSSQCHFVAGVPVRPMLAKPASGIAEVVKRFGNVEFTCEYKYDGERAQIHMLPGGGVRIYSRSCDSSTAKFPDIVAALPSLLAPGVTSVVLDCEAVAYDRATKKILPFQVLSTRGRKDVTVGSITVHVCLFAFDCLYLNGRTLLKENLAERRAALASAIKPVEGRMMLAESFVSQDLDELQTFLVKSVDAGTEGLIVKTLTDNATYEPAKRSLNWLKLKKDYVDGMGDSLDLVPIAAWRGKGKRTGWYGAFLLACYDEDGEGYQSVCKVGTGFSEELLLQLREKLQPTEIAGPKPYYAFGDTLDPDVWFEPTAVWEIKAADLSLSPVHRAGLGLVDPARGVALRFPRFLRLRDDKSPTQATSAAQVAEMYSAQAQQQQQQAGRVGGDDGGDDDE